MVGEYTKNRVNCQREDITCMSVVRACHGSGFLAFTERLGYIR